MKQTLKLKLLNDDSRMPAYATPGAACFDLFSTEDWMIATGEKAMIPTGLAFEIPTGYCMLVFPRSGMATKQGLRLSNCVGVIDSDYRGEVFVSLHNDSPYMQRVSMYERIAQAMIVPAEQHYLMAVNELSETERGDGGFGSTGA